VDNRFVTLVLPEHSLPMQPERIAPVVRLVNSKLFQVKMCAILARLVHSLHRLVWHAVLIVMLVHFKTQPVILSALTVQLVDHSNSLATLRVPHVLSVNSLALLDLVCVQTVHLVHLQTY
jgi:hypothetical protein